jgi:hypothetical protein
MSNLTPDEDNDSSKWHHIEPLLGTWRPSFQSLTHSSLQISQFLIDLLLPLKAGNIVLCKNKSKTENKQTKLLNTYYVSWPTLGPQEHHFRNIVSCLILFEDGEVWLLVKTEPQG